VLPMSATVDEQLTHRADMSNPRARSRCDRQLVHRRRFSRTQLNQGTTAQRRFRKIRRQHNQGTDHDDADANERTV
jgi:hypothetical protein